MTVIDDRQKRCLYQLMRIMMTVMMTVNDRGKRCQHLLMTVGMTVMMTVMMTVD